jgi:uncharacterized protein (TIGR00730 family)
MKQKAAVKAYKNVDFLTSPDARPMRILSEFLEPLRRFRYHRIKDTVVFFGSARLGPRAEALRTLKSLQRKSPRSAAARRRHQAKLEEAKIALEMSRYYEDAVEVARLITLWSSKLKEKNRFVVCSGGGPGIMEAANKGARRAKGISIGLNISLPFEQSANPYVPDDLNFEFHYFFMRKFWFVYLAKALIMFPGGFGTLDELMEVLTLLQTNKIKKKMTVILYGSEYWKRIINFDEMVRLRMISKEDTKLFRFADTPREASRILIQGLTVNYPEVTLPEQGQERTA